MKTKKTIFRKLLWVALLFPILLTIQPELAQASHFRYGTLTWAPSGPPGQVVFSLKCAFRRDGYTGTGGDGRPVTGNIITENIGGTGLSFGDATPSTGTLNFLVTAFSITENWVIGEALQPSTNNVGVPHAYAGAGPFTAFMSGSARIAALNNGSNGGYRLETIVTPLNGNFPPSSNQAPNVIVAVGSPATFTIVGSDNNSDPIRYRLATAAEKGFTGDIPNLTINNTTGVVSWNNVGLNQVNFWTLQVILEDLDGVGNVKSKTAVDFMLIIVPVIGNPPSCSLNAGGPITTSCISPISFDITATDPDANAIISINASGMPSGATMTPALPASGASGLTSTFNWTPTGAQLGSFTITFTLTDENNQQSQCTQQINVGVKSITPIGPTTICSGGSVLLTVSPPGTTYLWNNGETTQSIAASVAGIYSVTVDGIPSCNQSEVIVNSTIPTISANGPTTFCSGGTVVLTASPAGSALWSTGATTNSITVSTAGNYSVTLNACTSSPTAVIVNPLPGTFTPTSNSPVCVGSTLNLFATSSGAASYSWTGTNSFSSSVQNPSIPNASAADAGIYTAIASTAAGCTRSANVSVSINPLPSISASNSGTACSGTAATLIASATGNFTGSYSISSIPYLPETCLANAGPSGDDAVSAALNIGFSFSFFGTTYTQFGISTNGNIQLGSGGYLTTFSPSTIPTAATPNNFIGAPWCDLLPTVGQITYGTTGSSPNRKLIVCYNNVGFFSGGGVFNSQIILCEGSNIIEMHSSIISNTTANKAMGIENSTGTVGYAPPGRNLGIWSISTPEAWRFSPFSQSFTWSPTVSCQNVNCSTATVSPASSTTYTVSVTDVNGCSNSATTTIGDNLSPVPDVALLPDVTGECSVTVTAPTATDNCAGVVTGTTTDPTSYSTQGGPYTITWTYDDGNGNTSQQTQNVIVDDITAPVPDLALLPTITGECSASVSAPTATDNCEGTITGTTTDPTSYSVQGGPYIVTWTYDDGNGNTSQQTQNVIVDDVTAPVADVTSLPTITGECSASVSAPTATDNCEGAITGTTTDPTTYSAQGSYTITWTYDDGNGNTSSQTQTVIVDDITPPSISCPGNMTAAVNYAGCKATVNYIVTKSDNCTGSILTQTAGLPSGSAFPKGTTTNTFVVTDVGGNTATCSFTITVASTLSVNAGMDEQTYYGYIADQTVTHNAVASGGGGGYSYSWALSRPLMCNIVNSNGDESFSTGTCINNICPGTGSPLVAPSCSGSAAVTSMLIEDADLWVTVSDQYGCIARDTFHINSEDARCFAGNSGNVKVKVCHHTSSTTNPWVQICIAQAAVPTHLSENHGDYIGTCGSRLETDASASQFSMMVYPNPASDQVNIVFEAPVIDNYNLAIWDMTGRTVFNSNGVTVVDGNRITVPTNTIQSGIYSIQITVGDYSSISRLVISK